jgi:isocitrate/isopropylmalate dehydrogenase
MLSPINNITVAYGDGVGPEIMEAALIILREAGARISIETVEVGERIYNMGARYGILPSAWETLSRNKILLKAPVIIPPDKGYNELNEAIYEKYGLLSGNIISTNVLEDMPDSSFMKGTANIGEDFALFEAAHDAAADIARKNIVNPSGMIHASVMLLEHIGQAETASLIQNSWLKTIEDGIHTIDIYRKNISRKKAGTKEFTEAVIDRLGKAPKNSTGFKN